MRQLDKLSIDNLKNAVRSVVDILDNMDDTTYDAVNDFTDPDNGRYSDMIDWLQHIMSIR